MSFILSLQKQCRNLQLKRQKTVVFTTNYHIFVSGNEIFAEFVCKTINITHLKQYQIFKRIPV
jgi:hypothetical protein